MVDHFFAHPVGFSGKAHRGRKNRIDMNQVEVLRLIGGKIAADPA